MFTALLKGGKEGEMAEIAVNIVINKSLLNQEARLLGRVHTQVEDIKTELLYIQAFLKDADAKGEKEDARP